MDNRNRVSCTQLKALVVTIVIGTGVLSLPSNIAGEMDNDGWIGILLGGLLAIILVSIIDRFFKLYPNKDFFQLGQDMLSPILFKIYLIIFFTYFILLLSIIVRDFTEVVKVYLLETTPKEIIIIAMLLSMSYIARSEIEVLARLAVIIYPIVIVIPILLIIVTMPNTDYTNIFPVFQLDFPSLLRGTLMGLFSFGGYEFLLLSLPMVEDQEETLKSSLKGMSIVIIIYLLIFFITLSQYGIHQLKREIWPSIAIVKEISLPGYFLENLDGIFVAAWLMVVFGTLGPILHFTGVLLTEILNTKEHQYLILPIIPIIYMVSQYHKNLAQFVKNMVQIFNYFTIFTIMIMPTILFIIAAIKKRRENQ